MLFYQSIIKPKTGEKMKLVRQSICFLLCIVFLSHSQGFALEVDRLFKTVTYTGAGSSNSVNGVGFQPELIWFKNRNSAAAPAIMNTLTGWIHWHTPKGTTALYTELSELQLNSDGFIIPGNFGGAWNENNNQYVAWCWNASDSSVVNNDGNISSTVSANPETGFSVVQYSGSGATGSFGHGLNAAPGLVIIKCLTSASDWYVWHADGHPSKNLRLNKPDAELETGNRIYTVSDSTVTLTGGVIGLNQSNQDYIAYCWASVPGASSFGAYTGNGSSNGPDINIGFQPDFVMVKRIDYPANWALYDIKRDLDTSLNKPLYANSSQIEGTVLFAGLTSSGFKVDTSDAVVNASNGRYIYMAFSENPITVPDPEISFSTDKAVLNVDIQESATLSWTVNYADTVSISPGIGSVASSGSLIVTPGESTTYILTATTKGQAFTKSLYIDLVYGQPGDAPLEISTQGQVSVNSKLNLYKSLRLVPQNSPPENPVEGEIYFSSNKELLIYINGTWVIIVSSN